MDEIKLVDLMQTLRKLHPLSGVLRFFLHTCE